MIFVDRKPTYPNRMLITPESGGDPYYATVVRADEPTEVGTPLNAENLNKISTIESTDYPGCYYRIVDGENEWVNSPMVEGVEYRTTERWNGYPVYTKLVHKQLESQRFSDGKTWIAEAAAYYDVGASETDGILCVRCVGKGTMPGMSAADTTMCLYELVGADTWGVLWQSNYSLGPDLYATVWYVKTNK